MSYNTSIVVCGKKYDIGTKVILWDEPGGLNSYDESKITTSTTDRATGKIVKTVILGKRYSSRFTTDSNPSLEKLQTIVKQFFLHHSGLYHSKQTFDVLHKERKLSVQFILDNDGTLYQCLDLKEKAYHGGKNNAYSIGIEIDSKADSNKYPDAYDEYHCKKFNLLPQEKCIDKIHGSNFHGYCYTDKQYDALVCLMNGLLEIFPLIAKNPDFPRNTDGSFNKNVLKDPINYCGFICHLNTDSGKWDPVCLDRDRLLAGLKKSEINTSTENVQKTEGEEKIIVNDIKPVIKPAINISIFNPIYNVFKNILGVK